MAKTRTSPTSTIVTSDHDCERKGNAAFGIRRSETARMETSSVVLRSVPALAG